MFVNVEYTSDRIVFEVVVFATLGSLFRGFLEIDSPFDNVFLDPAGLDPQLDKAFLLDSKVVEVVPFRDDTLTNDQDPALYLSVWAATAQTIISLRHHLSAKLVTNSSE